MSQLSQKFDDFVNQYLHINNKYIVAIISGCLILYASYAAPALPDYVAQLFNNIVFKTVILFLILWVSLHFEPSVSLISAILVTIIFLTLNLYKKDMMRSLRVHDSVGVPKYVHTRCGKHVHVSDPVDALRKGTDPVSDISNAEVESLCMHLKKDKDATEEIMTSSEFSELLNADKACEFAKHQYAMNFPKVECEKDVKGNEPVMSSLAPIN